MWVPHFVHLVCCLLMELTSFMFCHCLPACECCLSFILFSADLYSCLTSLWVLYLICLCCLLTNLLLYLYLLVCECCTVVLFTAWWLFYYSVSTNHVVSAATPCSFHSLSADISACQDVSAASCSSYLPSTDPFCSVSACQSALHGLVFQRLWVSSVPHPLYLFCQRLWVASLILICCL